MSAVGDRVRLAEKAGWCVRLRYHSDGVVVDIFRPGEEFPCSHPDIDYDDYRDRLRLTTKDMDKMGMPKLPPEVS